jgi:type IV pilus assembly protein PilF
MLRSSLALALLLVAGCASAGKKDAQVQASLRLSETGRVNLALAQMSLEAGKLAQAEVLARKAMATDAGNGRVHALMGVIQSRLQRPDKARAEFERALQLGASDGTVFNVYGAWQCENGDAAGADQTFQTAIRMRGVSLPSVYSNAGRCASQVRDWAKARVYLREGLRLAPTDRPMLLMLSEAELRLGNTLEARAFVQRSDALGADAGTLALAARVEDAAGDASAAARYRKRLRDQFPGYVPTGEGASAQ